MMNPKHQKWWVLTAICFLMLLLNIDITALNLAVPPIAHDFHASLNDMQWLITGYVLMCAILTIPGGTWGDQFGHAKIFNIGALLFVIASLLAGLANSTSFLIAARCLQGVAMGISIPVAVVLIYAVFPKNQHGLAMGYTMACVGLGTAIGPTLSGFLLHYFNWRWIFFINVPIGLITVLCCLFAKPPFQKQHKKSLDWQGMLVLLPGLVGLSLASNQEQNWGISSWPFLTALFVGIAAFIVLYFVEKNKTNPAFNFSLFSIRNAWVTLVVRTNYQLIFIPLIFFVPIFLIDISGFSPIKTGLVMLFLTMILGTVSPFAGSWTDRVGIKRPLLFSLLLIVIATALFAVIPAHPTLSQLALPLILSGLSCSICYICTMNGFMASLKPEEQGMGSGIFFTLAWVSCGIGTGVMAMIVAFFSKKVVLQSIQRLGLHLSPLQLHELLRVATGIIPLDHLAQHTHATHLKTIATTAFMSGFHVSMWILTLLGIFTLWICFYYREDPFKNTSIK